MTRHSLPATPEVGSEAPLEEGCPGATPPDPLLALARQAAGDREALARLLSLVGPSIVAAIRVLIGADQTELEDAAQEAMIAIAASVRRFRGESTFLHYARRIAVRTAFAMRRARVEASRKALDPVTPPLMNSSSSAGSAAEGVERQQRLDLFRRLLDELPEGQAESLTYRVLLDYPLPVIARETGVPVNTVRSRIRLARNHLRDRILGDPELAELLRGWP